LPVGDVTEDRPQWRQRAVSRLPSQPSSAVTSHRVSTSIFAVSLSEAESRSVLDERALVRGRHIFGWYFPFRVAQLRDARARGGKLSSLATGRLKASWDPVDERVLLPTGQISPVHLGPQFDNLRMDPINIGPVPGRRQLKDINPVCHKTDTDIGVPIEAQGQIRLSTALYVGRKTNRLGEKGSHQNSD
jgi:hypothetical protein